MQANVLGVRLNGEGYVEMQRGLWVPRKETKIMLTFKTFASNGMLFYVGKEVSEQKLNQIVFIIFCYKPNFPKNLLRLSAIIYQLKCAVERFTRITILDPGPRTLPLQMSTTTVNGTMSNSIVLEKMQS